MHDKEFDRIIRERLKDVGSRHQPSGWAYLERRLNAEGSPEAGRGQAEDAFDDALRQKLQPQGASVLPPDWSAMEELLDASSTGTQAPTTESFDQVIFQKLRNLHLPFRQQHWASMADKLDRELVNSGTVWRSKAIELSLLVFLVFTFWQQFTPANIPNGAAADLRTTDQRQEPVSELTAPASPSEIAPEAVSDGVIGQTSRPSPAGRVESSTAPLSLEEEASSGFTNASLSGGSALPPRLPVRQNLPAFTPGWKKALIPVRPASAAQGPTSLATGLLTPLQTIPPGQARSAHADQVFEPGPISPVQKRPFIYLSMLGSVDYNRIISPSARFLDVRLREFDRYELGYSAGFNLGFDFGQWEIQTGAVYSAKHYRPLQAEFWDGAFDEGYAKVQLKDIKLNIVQLPLLLRFNLIQYDRWRFYVLAGGTVHVAVSANYYYDNIGTPNKEVLEPNRGWLDGGSFRENSYMTGNIGLGLERFMTPQWSLFAQPTYHHAINLLNHGMGPSRDRISTMSLYTGIRIRLRQ